MRRRIWWPASCSTPRGGCARAPGRRTSASSPGAHPAGSTRPRRPARPGWNPGAVPSLLGSTSAPEGRSACFSCARFMAPPRASTRRLMASSELSSRARVVPTAWAAAAAVRSRRSVVGPSPPVQMTKRLAAPRRRGSDDPGIPLPSGTSSTVATTNPAPVSVAAIHDALVFTISPRVSSVPMERMATKLFSLARGFLQCCGEKENSMSTARSRAPSRPPGPCAAPPG